MTFDGDVIASAGVPVIRPIGDLDLGSAPGFEQALMPSLAVPPGAVADLGMVRFMDSSGVATLVRAQLACGEHGTTLALAGVSGQVQRVLDLTGLSDVLYITSSVEAACEEVLRAGSSDR